MVMHTLVVWLQVETDGGTTEQWCRRHAMRLHCTVFCGFPYKPPMQATQDTGQPNDTDVPYFNSMLIVGPDGNVLERLPPPNHQCVFLGLHQKHWVSGHWPHPPPNSAAASISGAPPAIPYQGVLVGLHTNPFPPHTYPTHPTPCRPPLPFDPFSSAHYSARHVQVRVRKKSSRRVIFFGSNCESTMLASTEKKLAHWDNFFVLAFTAKKIT